MERCRDRGPWPTVSIVITAHPAGYAFCYALTRSLDAHL